MRQHARYDQRNAACHSMFAKSDTVSERVCKDPDLAAAWALDRSVTTAETATRPRRRLDGEFAKIGKEWFLSESSVNAGKSKAAARAPQVLSALAAAALRER